jgi:hypothetical protein
MFRSNHGRAMRETADRVYTIEIGGRAILSFPAKSLREAQSLLREAWLLDDLRAVKSNGVAVWDGRTRLVVRNADPAEEARFVREAKHNDADDLPIVYLIELY